jgi:hypothetical protein
LRRAVGRNWLRDALVRRLSSWTSDRLLGDVLRAILTAETPGEGEEVPRLKRWCTYLRARGSRGSSARRSRGVRAAPTVDGSRELPARSLLSRGPATPIRLLPLRARHSPPSSRAGACLRFGRFLFGDLKLDSALGILHSSHTRQHTSSSAHPPHIPDKAPRRPPRTTSVNSRGSP